MSLLINNLDNSDVLSSYNFARLSDIVFSEVVTKEQYEELKTKHTKVLEETDSTIFYSVDEIDLRENSIIFTNTYLVNELFNKLNSCNFKNIKVITSQTDHKIDKKRFKKMPNCISKWYSINVTHQDEKLVPIPLGLANEYSPKNVLKKNFLDIAVGSKKINKIYLNFEINTNYFHRQKIKKYFSTKSIVQIEENKIDNKQYLERLNKHNFVLCPWGNGIDTHRIWETIYAGSIPLIPNHHIFSSIFGNDELLFNNFVEIETKIDKLQNNFLENFDNKIMTMHYWSERIVNAKRVNKKKKSQNIKFNLKDIEINYKNFKKKESKIKKYNTFIRKVHNKVVNFQIKIS
jgi:CRISPR/Cas system-associated endoribonuclease Cas2